MKGIIILIGIALVIFVGFYLIKKKDSKEGFHIVATQIRKVKFDLSKLLVNSIGNGVLPVFRTQLAGFRENSILGCVYESMVKEGINISEFNMDGNDMSEPIVKMYEKNPKLYEILSKCKYLDMIGRIVGLAAWGAAGGKNVQGIQRFCECLDKVNFSDINTWKKISENDGPIFSCLQ